MKRENIEKAIQLSAELQATEENIEMLEQTPTVLTLRGEEGWSVNIYNTDNAGRYPELQKEIMEKAKAGLLKFLLKKREAILSHIDAID